MPPPAMLDQFRQFSGVGGNDSFPNPWLDVASLSMPQNLRSALYWAEFLWSSTDTFSTAMERTISYFLTEIEVHNASDDETEKWKPLLNDTLGGLGLTQNMLRNRACYGNSFASLIVPFYRWLHCPRCGNGVPLKEAYDNPRFNFSWQMPEFVASCPWCKVGSGFRGAFRVDDKPDAREDRLRLKVWSPHDIEILYHPYDDHTQYLWRVPADLKLGVTKGHLYYLERTPRGVIDCVHHNQMFRFADDALFHMKEPTLAGLFTRGWGLPRVLTHFRQVYYVQVLRRFNEAIALDYVVPFRIITPGARAGQGGGSDPLMRYSGGDFRAQAQAMVRRRRRDPAALQVFPFPIEFQMFGADANQLAPRDLLDQGTESLLNACGTPVELYNGSLQLQTAPVALRLFESTWYHLVLDCNRFLTWLVRQVAGVLNWEEVEARLKRVTIADDIEAKTLIAQLAVSQQVSATTLLSQLGLDWKKEQRGTAAEAVYQASLQSRTQEEMGQAGFAQQIAKGQAAQGGAQGGQGQAPAAAGAGGGAADPTMGGMVPGGGGPVDAYLQSMGPNTPITPQDLMATAQSMAQELLGLPETQKDSQLKKLNQYNKVLHDVVQGSMNSQRRGAQQAAASGQPAGGA